MMFMEPEHEQAELEDELRRVRHEREKALAGVHNLRVRELSLELALTQIREALAVDEDDGA